MIYSGVRWCVCRSGLPHIPITAQATVTDQNNNEVACIKIDIEF